MGNNPQEHGRETVCMSVCVRVCVGCVWGGGVWGVCGGCVCVCVWVGVGVCVGGWVWVCVYECECMCVCNYDSEKVVKDLARCQLK